jgi:hypothetical protein
MEKVTGQLTNKETVVELWGEEFERLSENPRVVFLENEIRVRLKAEVKLASGETTKVLTLREPTVGDLKATDAVKGDVTKSAVLLASCADLPDAVVSKMLGSDFVLVNKVIGAFLSDGLGTGES